MPRLILANMDELYSAGSRQNAVVLERALRMAPPRFALGLRAEDCLLAAAPVEPGFLAYLGQVTGIALQSAQILTPASHAGSLCEDVLADQELLSELRRRCPPENAWIVCPYVQSTAALELADSLKLPCEGTAPQHVREGLIERLNNKGEFRRMARSLGVRVAPGRDAENAIGLRVALQELRNRGVSRAVVKHAVSCGGVGHVEGSVTQLEETVPEWYRGGAVVAESFLPLVSVYGSLVNISDQGCEYLGTDQQIVRNNSWEGFFFPVPASTLEAEIREQSLRFAEHARAQGARGYSNIDWGVTCTPGQEPEAWALECNFRGNGFSQLLEFATRQTGGTPRAMIYDDHVPVGSSIRSVEDVLKRLESRKSPPGRCVVAIPPHDGRCSLLFLSEQTEEVHVLRVHAREILAP